MNGNMAAIFTSTAMINLISGKRHLGENRYTVIGFHAVIMGMLITKRHNFLDREKLIRRLGFLQTDHVDRVRTQPVEDLR